jgi:subtilisin family serine protease
VKRTRRSRHVNIETCEQRVLLSNVAAVWFESSALKSELPTLQPGDGTDWIIRLSEEKSLTSVADFSQYLEKLPFKSTIVGGIGEVNAAVIRTWGISNSIVSSALSDNFINFKLDSELTMDLLPNDEFFNQSWGLENNGQKMAGMNGRKDADIDASAAWDITTGSKSTVVAIIDTGIDYNHPDLIDNIWANPGEIPNDGIDNDENGFVDDIHGWDFRNNDNDPIDEHYHGTHVAGIIGAKGNNSIGSVGVNWDISMMALKIFDARGGGTDSDAISAINYATMMKERGTNIRAINASWGMNEYSQPLYNAIESAGQSNILFVAAAGNKFRNTDLKPYYPASFDLDNIISVGASANTEIRAWFSNYGVKSVDLFAPGQTIQSTFPNGGYGQLSGTSMAAPFVTGVIGLVTTKYPNLSMDKVKLSLIRGVDNKLGRLTSQYQNSVSLGRLNANGVLKYARLHP